MLYLVRHFGDREDSGKRCGICDFCAPNKATASSSRGPDSAEAGIISRSISTLKDDGGMGTGKLYNTVCPGSSLTRSDFENLLRSLVKAGLINLSEQSFEKDGEMIRYQKAELTHEGYSIDPKDITSLSLSLQCSSGIGSSNTKTQSRRKDIKVIKRPAYLTTEDPELYKNLKEWRLRLAKKQGLPAFRIFSNRVLENLVSDLPTTHDELLRVEGVGQRFNEKFGNEVIRLVKEYLRGVSD
jgi:superfamily II DNA helicase RecQ